MWVTKSLVFRYHTGSLAFGAAIIAIVQFIRAVLEYIDHKLKGVVIILLISGLPNVFLKVKVI